MITIFGYGSLMNEESIKKTLASVSNLRPVRLYGFVRVFDFPSTTRFSEIDKRPCAVLNIQETSPDKFINGVCFDIKEEDFENYKKREEGYELIKVIVEELTTNKKIEAITVQAKTNSPTEFIFESATQIEYLHTCISGCRDISEEYVEHFHKTTIINGKILEEIEIEEIKRH